MYSLMSDKGTDIIARKVDGTPILEISGGCDNAGYCSGADNSVKNTLDRLAEDFDSENLTPEKQKYYSQILEKGLLKKDETGKHVSFNDKGWAWNFESSARLRAKLMVDSQ